MYIYFLIYENPFACDYEHKNHRPALEDLAGNRYWIDARIERLPWHETAGQPLIGGPDFNLHQTIVDSIAPAMPLKAVFSRR